MRQRYRDMDRYYDFPSGLTVRIKSTRACTYKISNLIGEVPVSREAMSRIIQFARTKNPGRLHRMKTDMAR